MLQSVPECPRVPPGSRVFQSACRVFQRDSREIVRYVSVILAERDKPRTPEQYDSICCAELPDRNAEPELYQIVTDCMMHGPCGDDDPLCPCMRNRKCSKRFPKEWNELSRETNGYPVYRRRRNGSQPAVQADGVTAIIRYCMKKVRRALGQPQREVALDSRHVVTYNRALCLRYNVSVTPA